MTRAQNPRHTRPYLSGSAPRGRRSDFRPLEDLSGLRILANGTGAPEARLGRGARTDAAYSLRTLGHGESARITRCVDRPTGEGRTDPPDLAV